MSEHSERIIEDLVTKTLLMNNVIEALAKRVAALEKAVFTEQTLARVEDN